MNKIYHFLRLVRFFNLVVIALTMLVVQYFIKSHLYQEDIVFSENSIEIIDIKILNQAFYLLILTTALIAAAGNIINDYFDVKADRINKPNRLIIDTHIKRRWAMAWHWLFNMLGLILSLYLGYVLQNIWIPISGFASINLLWLYSAYYKRKPLIGNIIVASLLGGVPLYILILNYYRINFVTAYSIDPIEYTSSFYFTTILSVSVIALLMNLIRELVKDIIDIRGDLRLNAKTFPIKYGIKKTKYLIFFISILLFSALAFYYLYILNSNTNFKLSNYQLFSINLFASVLLSLLALTIAFKYNKVKYYKYSSNLFKLAILCGLLTLLFI